MMEDRFTRGFLAGSIGGIASTAVDIPLYLLKIASYRLIDYGAVFIYGYLPKTFFETFFALLIHWGFAAFGGGIFVYLVRFIAEKNFVFKGWLFGIGIWFTVYLLAFFFKVPHFTITRFPTVLTNFVASSTYGIIMALTFLFWESKLPEAHQ